MASAVLSARLRTARRAGRDPYDVFAHQQAAMPEQLLLLGQEEQPTQKKADPVPIDIAALRTDLERLELTADQLLQEPRPRTWPGACHTCRAPPARLRWGNRARCPAATRLAFDSLRHSDGDDRRGSAPRTPAVRSTARRWAMPARWAGLREEA
ncbi:hypothetical protein [Streptomyces mirabilis]|uniref:hypothetical protein n=1 Tax=Streptomyces mirabilis TaxID=68239 RepID=UPI00332C3F46